MLLIVNFNTISKQGLFIVIEHSFHKKANMIRSKIRKVKKFESIEIKSVINKIFHVPKSYFATRLQNKVFF